LPAFLDMCPVAGSRIRLVWSGTSASCHVCTVGLASMPL
jgi:hypothetical protein